MGGIEFSIGLIVLVVGWLLWSLKGQSIKVYFGTKTGQGILKGIVIAVVFGLVFVLIGCTGTYFNDASVYTGLDYTAEQSPQCRSFGADDKTTSNLGLKLNLYESEDESFRTNAKYTHHSCAFNPDKANYDAIGIELEYKFYSRPKR